MNLAERFRKLTRKSVGPLKRKKAHRKQRQTEAEYIKILKRVQDAAARGEWKTSRFFATWEWAAMHNLELIQRLSDDGFITSVERSDGYPSRLGIKHNGHLLTIIWGDEE